ncbi:MAG: hypothetical protein KF752_06915 [Pirellulaceae bacterium]|nr:hypothetical protein [Pirellulaceae bacterium]
MLQPLEPLQAYKRAAVVELHRIEELFGRGIWQSSKEIELINVAKCRSKYQQ